MADNVIELNGKRYDAITGAYLGGGDGKPYVPPSATYSKKGPGKTSGRHIDGFIKPAGAHPKVIKPAPTKPVAKHAHVKPIAKPAAMGKPVASAHLPKPATQPAHKSHKPAHEPNKTATSAKRTPVAVKPHRPEHAKTLMRHVVRKPAHSIKPAIKTQAPAEIASQPASSILFKPSVSRIDEDRLKRAKAIAKYSGIRHFMPVKPDYSPKLMENTPRHAPAGVPVIAVRPVPAHAHGHKAATSKQRTHTDIFEAAIARADSHKQPTHRAAHRSKHRRLVNTLAVVGAFLVIGGFVTYLNMPNIELHVASIQAGFKADMPDYKPAGYALQGGVQRNGNTISLRFQSGENRYTITQQPSDWNSQTLQENTLALAGKKHKTVEAGGRTIFIYNGSNAVWVNSGVRYDLNTNAPLSTEDITKLAVSL